MANYTNMADLVATYVEAQEGTYLNVEATINDVPLMCDIYRVADETVLTPEILTGCTENDANTQIIVGKDMSVASETTFIPPYRCKGVFICDIGTFTNDGTISMTARGAAGEGKDILLHGTYMISATGGAGGASRSYYGAGQNKLNGDGGSTPSEGVLSCAGGGSGGIFYHTDTNKTIASGAGGRGTSFSGGAGGGGAVGIDNGATGGTGSSSGGAGGNHAAGGSGTYTMNSAGGAGNPAGSNYRNSISPAYDSNDGIGTGGLIVILASEIIGSGDFESKGSNARGFVSSYKQSATGGGSGGGCIALLARNIDLTGEYFVSGGAGGANGNGSGAAGGSGVYAEIVVSDLILVHLPFKAAITDKEHLPNVSPSNQARLLAMLDDDELYYEILGKRHRVSTGHYIKDEEGNAVTKRDDLVVNSPLTVEDDSTNEKTVIGADTSGSLDFTKIVAPGVTHDPVYGNPVGTVISFFGYEAPLGYLICDGTEYAKADYPYLATHLADLDTHYSTTAYAGSDSDHFKVPDLRGEFLRGTGTNSHTNQGNGANVGVHQNGTEIPYTRLFENLNILQLRKPVSNADVINTETTNYYNYVTSNTGTDSGQSSFTSRPTNTSVLYCIKYN